MNNSWSPASEFIMASPLHGSTVRRKINRPWPRQPLVRQGLYPAQILPLVDGSWSAARGSIWVAASSARAKPLKMASATW